MYDVERCFARRREIARKLKVPVERVGAMRNGGDVVNAYLKKGAAMTSYVEVKPDGSVRVWRDYVRRATPDAYVLAPLPEDGKAPKIAGFRQRTGYGRWDYYAE